MKSTRSDKRGHWPRGKRRNRDAGNWQRIRLALSRFIDNEWQQFGKISYCALARELHEKFPKLIRRVTPRRLAFAEAALRRERERLPLFATEVAAEQPTAIDRLVAIDADKQTYWQTMRDHRARMWRECRRRLRQAGEVGAAVYAEWQDGSLPGSTEYLADLLRRRGIS